MDSEKHRYVIGESCQSYSLGRKIGWGGQGRVFEVEDMPRAVKILDKASPMDQEKLKNRIRSVRRLPISDLPISKPIEMLASPDIGYVMELATEMEPFGSLLNIPKGKDLPEWYLEGGGLGRRLRLLTQIADVFSRLHGLGIAYGDPSPSNILISSNSDSEEVFFIDPDNICYESSPDCAKIYTRGYGAPELLSGESGVNTLTDAHAFSIILFKSLTLVHPFIGNKVVNGKPELEDQAFKFGLPYIDDPDDKSNLSTYGLPREIVFSESLRELCEKAFTKGIQDPDSKENIKGIKRPGMSQWLSALHAATARILDCPNCGWSYYFNQKKCPSCESPRPTFLFAQFHQWFPEEERVVERKSDTQFLTIKNDSKIILTTKFTKGTFYEETEEAEVYFKDGRMALRVRGENEYALTRWNGSRERQLSKKWAQVFFYGNKAEEILHFGPLNKPHRIARFDIIKGEDA